MLVLSGTRSLEFRASECYLFSLLSLIKFTADSITALMYKIANKQHPSPNSINPDVPRCVTIIINRAMEKDVKKRYRRGKEMAQDIRKCLKIIHVEGKI